MEPYNSTSLFMDEECKTQSDKTELSKGTELLTGDR